MLDRYPEIDRRKIFTNVTAENKISDSKKLLIIILSVAESISENP
jgi:hypothetical protein